MVTSENATNAKRPPNTKIVNLPRNRLYEREALANTSSIYAMECPDCGIEALSIEPDDVRTDLSTQPLSLAETLFELDEGATIDVYRHCWVCGHQEVRTVTIESVDSQASDEAIIDQEHLLSQFENKYNYA